MSAQQAAPVIPVKPPIVTPAQESMPEPQPVRRTFYARPSGLVISVSKGTRAMIDGELRRIDEKIVEFMPMADGFGIYTTDDPDVIAYLEKRCVAQGDVMLPERYNDLSTPVEKRLEASRANERRLIEENNRLLAMLGKK